jgi:hypothetical protein
MTKQITLLTVLTLTVVLASVPAFAQGKGAGAGVGSQGKIGGGGNPRVDAPGVKGSSTDGDAKDKGSKDVKSSSDKGAGKADFVSRIEANSKLSAKLQTLLGSNVSLSQAAMGFKNEGQFIAAVHVAHNLNIPFDQLKAKMTGPDSMSLGSAIKALRPDMTDAQAKEAAKKADKEAKETEKN